MNKYLVSQNISQMSGPFCNTFAIEKDAINMQQSIF